jgi:hypothetical protein
LYEIQDKALFGTTYALSIKKETKNKADLRVKKKMKFDEYVEFFFEDLNTQSNKLEIIHIHELKICFRSSLN